MNFLQRFLNFFTKKQVLFRIGDIVFLYYGLIIAVTMFFAYLIGGVVLQSFSVEAWIMPYLIVFTIPLIPVFSRMIPLLLYPIDFLKNPRKTFRNNWFSYLGGFIGFWIGYGSLIAFFGLDLLRLSDAIFLLLPFAHALGRLASINYGCCGLGVEDKKTKGLYFCYNNPDAMVSEVLNMKNKRLVPVHLYEMLLNFALGFLMIFVLFSVETHGFVSGIYLVGYGLIRFYLEPQRLEDKKILFRKYSLYQILLTLIFVGFGVVFFVLAFSSDTQIILSFSFDYIYNSLKNIPIIFLMSVVAFVLFGMRVRKRNV